MQCALLLRHRFVPVRFLIRNQSIVFWGVFLGLFRIRVVASLCAWLAGGLGVVCCCLVSSGLLDKNLCSRTEEGGSDEEVKSSNCVSSSSTPCRRGCSLFKVFAIHPWKAGAADG